MIPDSVIGLLVAFTLIVSFFQRTPERQHAAFVYGVICAAHFMVFERFKLGGVLFYWPIYYMAAGAFSLLIIMGIHNLPAYTKFHERLQCIALASIGVNFIGGAIQYLDGSLMIYQGLALALYLILIKEILTDGGHTRASKDTGLFRHFLWPSV